MSEPNLHASGAEPALELDAFYQADTRRNAHRSPALSIALSLGVCGGLLATSEHQPLPHLTWTLVFFLLAVEADVRRLAVPLWLSLPPLFVQVLALATLDGPTSALQAVYAAALGGALLLPFWYRGHANTGSLAVMALLGALWGPWNMIAVAAWAAILGAPFVAIRVAAGANSATLPLTVLLGLGAAAHQLF
jgi:hypothetical protein